MRSLGSDDRFHYSNELAMLPAGKQPMYPIMLEKLRAMETCIEELHAVVTRLVCLHIVGCHEWILTPAFGRISSSKK